MNTNEIQDFEWMYDTTNYVKGARGYEWMHNMNEADLLCVEISRFLPFKVRVAAAFERAYRDAIAAEKK
jgi:hypothetical protein